MIRIITKARLVAFAILIISLIPQYSQANIIDDVEDQIRELFLDEQDVKCLAKNIYYESRGEPKEGKVAVGIVTLNRVDHPQYPKSICDVVYQRTKSREGKTVCQFSWTCKKMATPKAGNPLWEESVRIAKNILLGKYSLWEEKYERAHHFHSTSVNPGWNLRRVARIGRHIFYH
jgi:spore germination cell wall hydrolase CwlJ-like protein